MRGETACALFCEAVCSNFNPLPSCEGRPILGAYLDELKEISIHSPHARGDAHVQAIRDAHDISIHSPHARGDVLAAYTPSEYYNFNPLPSCEGRRFARVYGV